MKFSLNLAQYYSDVDFKSFDIDVVVEKMGLQLGAIESVEMYTEKYENVVVAKVVNCIKHPNADKLSLCLVDDGGAVSGVERNEDGYVQVVCGAPNVQEGIHVAWIPPGAVVPASRDKEPFTLEARELRGKVSNGMIASPAELAMSDDHDGILEIKSEDIGRDPVVGENFSNLYGLDDVIIDCENKMFTHRPDCFGNIGIAREVAGIMGEKYKSPDFYREKPIFISKDDIQLNVANEASELVSRIMFVAMSDVEIKPSPLWMQGFLNRAGIKPINNVVDVTNYIMHFLGQPLHAFDYDKLQKVSNNPSLQSRMAAKGEELELINGKKIVLDESDVVISTDKKVVALAGIMGGVETEVDENTKNIVIECANFDMYAVRRTSMRHGLFTDAVTRFNKGQSPLQNDRALVYAMKLLESYASASQSSDVYDLCSFDTSVDNLNHLTVEAQFINSRLGTSISAEDMKTLLENVEFKVQVNGDVLNITVPFWRMDIAIGEDIVEEIGRLYGYQNVPVKLPVRNSKAAPKNEARVFKQRLRDQLVKSGANEVLTYSFVHGELMKKTGTDPDKWAYHLRNALSPDLQYYRTSLVPSLLAKVHGNLKAGAGGTDNKFAIFELGKAHVKDHMEESPEDKLPKQMRRLSFAIVADDKSSKNLEGSAYYQAKKYVDVITSGKAEYSPLETNEYPITAPYQIGRSAVITLAKDQPPIGVIGELRSSVKKALKLPDYCAAFEIDTDYLRQEVTASKYTPLSDFPSSTQDVTFEVSDKTSWSTLENFIRAELDVAHAENGYGYELEPRSIFQEDNSDMKRITFSIELNHPHKTLKTDEVSALVEQISKAAKESLDAARI